MSDSLAPTSTTDADVIVLADHAATPGEEVVPDSAILDETLVEEVSIDGMCGVY